MKKWGTTQDPHCMEWQVWGTPRTAFGELMCLWLSEGALGHLFIPILKRNIQRGQDTE